MRKLTDLDAPAIAAAMERGVETAYKAVMKPKEGTILTVARAAADRALELADSASDLDTFFDGIFQHAEETLARTPEMLPVLKEAGVVDSGGQGLLEVLRGAIDGYHGKEVDYSQFEASAAPKITKISPQAEADINSDTVQSLSSFLRNRFHRKRSAVSVNFWILSETPLYW